MFFYLFVLLVILQRLWELKLAKRNYDWAIEQGGMEIGREHYKWMWLLHTTFFISLLAEYSWIQPEQPSWSLYPFVFFLLAQALRIWAIFSLGRFWNTRIVIIPGSAPKVSGPYRFIRHPNYLAVIIEIASIPLIFGLFFTATLYTLGNAILLIHRIRIEEYGLYEHTTYFDIMQNTPRILPRRRR